METNLTVTNIADPKLGSTKMWKLKTRRAKDSLLITLCLLGFLLTSGNALAAEWLAATIDGQGGPNGRVWSRMLPWSSIQVGSSFYVYATGNNGTIYEGSFANGDWHFTPIFSDLNFGALTASATLVYNGLPRVHVAHVDSDLDLQLTTWSPFGGWSTQSVDGLGQGTFNNLGPEIATVEFKGKLFIFYREWNQPWVGKNVLRCAIYDGSQFTYQVVDGNGIGGRISANLTQPAAVAAPDGVHVYYYDEDHLVLREAHSPDGVSFTNFANLDGTGQNGGIVGDVGHHPSAIFYNGKINVFYEDRTNVRLRVAQFSDKWRFGSIDALDTNSYNAPVIHNNAMLQVYYTSNGQLRAAWGTSPANFNEIPLDGPGGDAQGSVPDTMYTPVTAVEFNNAPWVFYEDSANGALRNSHWVP